MAVFLIDRGYFEEARKELEKALVYHEELAGVYNNWGYYYYRKREYQKAIDFIKKALELSPKNFGYYNNLGFAFYEAGKKRDSFRAFQRSMELNHKQPKIQTFLKEKLEYDCRKQGKQ